MIVAEKDALAKLATLISESKDSVKAEDVTADKMLINDLGFDSLDTLQLSRKITRAFGVHFELDTWSQGPGTVQSIIDQIYADEGSPVSVA
jgi:acyl carrier protein